MLTISFGVLAFRSFRVWGWFSHALLFNVPHNSLATSPLRLSSSCNISIQQIDPTPVATLCVLDEDRPVCGANEKLRKIH